MKVTIATRCKIISDYVITALAAEDHRPHSLSFPVSLAADLDHLWLAVVHSHHFGVASYILHLKNNHKHIQ